MFCVTYTYDGGVWDHEVFARLFCFYLSHQVLILLFLHFILPFRRFFRLHFPPELLHCITTTYITTQSHWVLLSGWECSLVTFDTLSGDALLLIQIELFGERG